MGSLGRRGVKGSRVELNESNGINRELKMPYTIIYSLEDAYIKRRIHFTLNSRLHSPKQIYVGIAIPNHRYSHLQSENFIFHNLILT